MYSLRRKSTRKFNVGAKVCDEKKNKEKWNKGSSSLRARLHLVKPATCKNKRPK